LEVRANSISISSVLLPVQYQVPLAKALAQNRRNPPFEFFYLFIFYFIFLTQILFTYQRGCVEVSPKSYFIHETASHIVPLRRTVTETSLGVAPELIRQRNRNGSRKTKIQTIEQCNRATMLNGNRDKSRGCARVNSTEEQEEKDAEPRSLQVAIGGGHPSRSYSHTMTVRWLIIQVVFATAQSLISFLHASLNILRSVRYSIAFHCVFF
jgi:hypothetical protein